ncbi:MAG: hypothetical protein FWD97_07980 [Defluviitaleaceae bacterium]|nr:hypothetical protein [Defluviitaleaceae bacterium]
MVSFVELGRAMPAPTVNTLPAPSLRAKRSNLLLADVRLLRFARNDGG